MEAPSKKLQHVGPASKLEFFGGSALPWFLFFKILQINILITQKRCVAK
jgi:hypothetical protein